MLGLPESTCAKVKLYALIGVCVAVSSLTSISSGEQIQYQTCGGTGSGLKDSCSVTNVTVDPCPEAAENETCNAYRGTNMSISFDFVPPFSGDTYKSQVYSSNLLVDIPDIDHDRDGCKYAKCPIKAGEKHAFKSTRFVKEVYPAGTYLVKYRLWQESSNSECCFLVPVNIL